MKKYILCLTILFGLVGLESILAQSKDNILKSFPVSNLFSDVGKKNFDSKLSIIGSSKYSLAGPELYTTTAKRDLSKLKINNNFANKLTTSISAQSLSFAHRIKKQLKEYDAKSNPILKGINYFSAKKSNL